MRRIPAGPSARFPHAMLAALIAIVAALCASAASAALPIESWRTSTGARVLFVRADAIPMLDVNIDFDAGSRFDPADKAGLAAVTNAMLAKGADGLDESTIAEGFARLGAQRGGGAGDDRASVSLRTLTSATEQAQALELLERVIARPTFPADVLSRERERQVHALREAETKPENIAQRTFSKLIYPSHPYGVEPDTRTIAAIGREDVERFYRDMYTARRAVVSMIGAISRADAERIAERLTARLPAGDAQAPSLPAVTPLAAGVTRRIDHPASQSHILIGMPAMARGDPDFFPLFVGNYVLGGGGFVSRLYNEVREKRGLAYSVYSYFAPQMQPGPFTIGLQTQKSQTDLALSVVADTLSAFVRDGPTPAELDAARQNLVGGFALRIDSNRKILDNLATIGFYDLPLDYLDQWTKRVEAVTVDQVRDAFRRRVDPAKVVTVVVGNGNGGGAGTAPAASAPAARPDNAASR